jgi:hypothetical protein
MPNNIPGQIISELGQIAQDVGKQAVQIPKDIAGKALESLGASSGKKPGTITPTQTSPEGGNPDTAWAKIGTEKDQQIKRSIARKALEELVAGMITKKREPSIWERLQMEQDQKKEQQTQQAAASRASSLPTSSGKRPRGDLYGTKAKKTATENRNVRQD